MTEEHIDQSPPHGHLLPLSMDTCRPYRQFSLFVATAVDLCHHQQMKKLINHHISKSTCQISFLSLQSPWREKEMNLWSYPWRVLSTLVFFFILVIRDLMYLL